MEPKNTGIRQIKRVTLDIMFNCPDETPLQNILQRWYQTVRRVLYVGNVGDFWRL